MGIFGHDESRQAHEDRMREALVLIKEAVVGDKNPRWSSDYATTVTRGKIADICDMAIGKVQPNDVGSTGGD